jgi:hypothetical protein
LERYVTFFQKFHDKRIGSSNPAYTYHKLTNLGLSSLRIDAILFTL